MTNETKSKLDSIARREELITNGPVCTIDIPCWTYYKKTGDIVTGTYHFVDLTDPEVRAKAKEELFSDFVEAQHSLFAKEFFMTPEDIRNNNNLIFIVEDKYQEEYFKIEHNFTSIRKRFINEKDIPLFLSLVNSKDISDFSSKFIFDEKSYPLKYFNCISGPNGSGKTMMMRAIADQFNVPLYSANIYSEVTKSNLKYMLDNLDKTAVDFYYKNLWGLSNYKKTISEVLMFSGYAEVAMLYIAAALTNNQENKNKILLIDDIFWNNLDSIRTLNLFETLGSSATPVVITSTVENPTGLVRKKIPGSNIIEL